MKYFYNNIRRFFAVLIILALCISLISCGGKEMNETLVIGNGQMNGVFSPFFAETANDEL